MKRLLADGWVQMFAAIAGLCAMILVADRLKPRAVPIDAEAASGALANVPAVPTAAVPAASNGTAPIDPATNNAMIKYVGGDYDGAKAILDKRLEANPADEPALVLRSMIAFRHLRYADAERDARAALALNPKDENPRRMLIESLGAQGRSKEALAEADAALRDNPDSSQLQEARRRALAGPDLTPAKKRSWDDAMEKFDGADYVNSERLFKKYLDAFPNEAPALGMHALSLMKLGRVDEAIADYRAQIALEPANETIRFILVGELLNRGRATEALAEADSALAVFPDSADLRSARVRALQLLGRAGPSDIASGGGSGSAETAAAQRPSAPPSSFPIFKITAKKAGRWVVSNEDGPDVDSPSIMRAVESAKDGDVILLKPGLYAEPLSVYKKTLTFRGLGARPEEVLVTSPNPNEVLRISHADVRLENLRIQPEKGYSAAAAAVRASSSRLALKDVVARSLGAAVQVDQGEDNEAVVDVAGGTLDGGYADLLMRGKGQAAVRGTTFSNPRQPVVVWRDVAVRLDACRFPDAGEVRLYAYADSRVDASPSGPPVVAERAAKDAEADKDRFTEDARGTPRLAPSTAAKSGNKWSRDIFRPGRTPGDIYQ